MVELAAGELDRAHEWIAGGSGGLSRPDWHVPFCLFTADKAYRQAQVSAGVVEDRDVSYVIAIRCSDTLAPSTAIPLAQ